MTMRENKFNVGCSVERASSEKLLECRPCSAVLAFLLVFVSALVGATPLRAGTVQNLFTVPNLEVYGIAVDLADQYAFFSANYYGGMIGAYDEVQKNPGVLSQAIQAPMGILLARNGIVVADQWTHQIRWLNPACDTNTVLAGSGVQGRADGTGDKAQFSNPAALAMDSQGNIYVADWNGLRKVDSANNVTTLATGFNKPAGVAVGNPGEFWIADTLNHVIKKVTVTDAGTTVTIVAGKQGVSGYVDDAHGQNARFSQPRGLLWVGGQTGLIVADSGNGAVRSVSYNSFCDCYTVSTIADGMKSPAGLAVDNEGAILVADPKFYGMNAVIRDAQAAPKFSPPPGRYSNAVTVSFVTDTLGIFSPTFHYTLDGSKPLLTSPSATRLTLDGGGADYTETINLRTFSPDLMTSPTASGTYSFYVATPVVTPNGATNNNEMLVTMQCATEGAEIYWTLDGSTPEPGKANLYTGPFILGQTGIMTVKAFKPGYAPSPVVAWPWVFYVSYPDILPGSQTSHNDLTISMFTETEGASLYYTTDGSYPDQNSTLYTGPFKLGKTCTIKAKGFRDGFQSSYAPSASYEFIVWEPYIFPNGATNDNPLQVTLSSPTIGASIFWTLDGSTPTPLSNPAVNGVPFTLATSGQLTAKAFKDGYTSSTNVTANFKFFVDPPQVTPGSMGSINSMDVSMGITTAGAVLHYTTDGSPPTTSSPVYTGPLTITSNTTLTVIATRDGFTSSPTLVNTYEIQVDTPVMNPPGGYFPDGGVLSLSVQRPDASIYYTANGADPTPSDTLYTGPFKIDQVHFSGDLRVIKARAYAPNTIPSAVISGSNVQTNSVGVPRNMVGGIGSTLVVPVVANLASNQQIRSLQFRLEVVPSSPGAPPLTNDLVGLDVSTNDFVPALAGSVDGKSVTNSYEPYTVGYTNGVYFYSVAANLLLRDFGLIQNFKIKVPNNALEGDTYWVSVLEVSGTSDAGQYISSITALPPRTLTVSNIHYLAGDACVGAWYNAGDFGDGNLDNGDVNAALDAALGIHQPYPFTDAFKAMDVYPETDSLIGDGLITYLDWQHILLRSLRRETNNWTRFWMIGGTLGHSPIILPDGGLQLKSAAAPLLANALHGTKSAAPLPGTEDAWVRQALIVAQSVTNLNPGAVCSMPVYVKVLPGFSLSGLQFRAVCSAENGAPEPGPVQFIRASGMPSPMTHLLSSPYEAACAWALGSFLQPLQGSNLLGYVTFQIPSDAKAGARYSVQVLAADGAVDSQTGLSLESASGTAWVQSGPTGPVHLVSDQWKTNFFCSASKLESDEEADPDHDGVPNWQEYLAGTNPTNALSRLEFSSTGVQSDQIVLRWKGAPGRVYVIERSIALTGAPWIPVSTNVCAEAEISGMAASLSTAESQFYRIRLQQP